ncbi:hypothetical protein GW17_00002263, partial [Ensete ventricosum]
IARSEEQLHFIPGLSAHRVCDLPEGIVFGPLDSPFSCLLHRMGQSVAKAAAVLVNTFEGLDPTIDAVFSASFSEYLHIGPLHLLVPPAGLTPDTHHCLPWLDRHAPATVAYVSFGSVMTPQPAELAALAEGLEASGAAFLWSLKDHARELLPPGFLDRTKERGLAVSWAPQLDVLRHAAVGAFVTHCGWNSVLEAMTAGVPMVCRPFFGDQRMNARSVSLAWKIGVEFEGGAITKEGVTRALDTVLKGEEGKRLRVTACELQAMTTRAVKEDADSVRGVGLVLDAASWRSAELNLPGRTSSRWGCGCWPWTMTGCASACSRPNSRTADTKVWVLLLRCCCGVVVVVVPRCVVGFYPRLGFELQSWFRDSCFFCSLELWMVSRLLLALGTRKSRFERLRRNWFI